MAVYLTNMLFLLVEAEFLLWQRPSTLKKKVFCTLASAQWILLSGLRHISIGADTLAYKTESFDVVLRTPWGTLLRAVWDAYFRMSGPKDPGYAVVVKMLQLMTHDYRVFLLIVAVIFTVPLGIFIYRYSSEPFTSFLIYSCLFSSFFAITGLRQTIATALVVLVGYQFIERRRWLPFLLLSLLAFTIHKSSLVFVPFYFLAEQRVTGRRTLLLLAAAALVSVVRVPLADTLKIRGGYEEYLGQYAGAGTWMFSAMLILIVLVALWRAPTVLDTCPGAKRWFNALLIALALTPLTFVNPSAMRVVQYYSIFLILLVPEIIRSFFDKHERLLAGYVAVTVLVFLFVRTNPQYLFFWQVP